MYRFLSRNGGIAREEFSLRDREEERTANVGRPEIKGFEQGRNVEEGKTTENAIKSTASVAEQSDGLATGNLVEVFRHPRCRSFPAR